MKNFVVCCVGQVNLVGGTEERRNVGTAQRQNGIDISCSKLRKMAVYLII